MHINLYRDEQKLVYLKDRYAFQSSTFSAEQPHGKSEPFLPLVGGSRVCRPAVDASAGSLQREDESLGERRLRRNLAQIDAQMDDGLRDLRSDTADNTIRAHQPCRGDGL